MKRLILSFLFLIIFATAVTPSFSYAKKSTKTSTKTEKETSKKKSTKEESDTKKEKESSKKDEKDDVSDKTTAKTAVEIEDKIDSELDFMDDEDDEEDEDTDDDTSDADTSTKSEEAADTDASTDTKAEEADTTDTETASEEATKATASETHTVITDPSIEQPDINAAAAIVMESKTGAILYEKNSDKKHYPASITKILTTLVALENADLDDKIKFKKSVLNAVEQDSTRIGIEPKEVISLEDCLYAVMLASANDVSAGVADNIGEDVKDFAKMMTERAKEIGCENSNFVNPHGLHSKKHFTTAYDMALITQVAIQNEQFCKIASSLTHTIPKTKKTAEKRVLYNHHKMLQDTEYYYDGIEYGKTGYTSKAGNTLVSVAKRGDLELICVVLKAEGLKNAYKDTKKLFNYGFRNYHVVTPLKDFPLNEKLSHTKYFESVSASEMEKLSPSVNMDYQVVLPKTTAKDDLSYNFYIAPDDNTGFLGNLDILNGEEKLTRLPISYEPPLTKIEIERQPEILHVVNDDPMPVRFIKRALAHRNLLAFLIASFILLVILIVGTHSIRSSEKRKKRKLKK